MKKMITIQVTMRPKSVITNQQSLKLKIKIFRPAQNIIWHLHQSIQIHAEILA